ncbi:MAG: YceI family protein [Streptosporangiaceae bacterium]|jgi:polyisoprenoid-binding protein YceI|nr:YceI family protein [Streptosporangiaceae bacterium]
MSAIASDLGITAGTWNIDPAHSEVTFKVRHLMSKVRGAFAEFSGAVVVADDVTTSTATAEIKTASVDTRTPDRDAHIKSAEILDVEKYPALTFATTGVRIDGGDYLVDGTLTVKDVTLPVTLEVEFNGVGLDPWGGTRAGFTATTSISRKAYGVEFNIPLQGDKVLLGDTIEITLEIQAVKV